MKTGQAEVVWRIVIIIIIIVGYLPHPHSNYSLRVGNVLAVHNSTRTSNGQEVELLLLLCLNNNNNCHYEVVAVLILTQPVI